MMVNTWFATHLYCFESLQDQLLLSCIVPLISKLKQRYLIDAWHFVREEDVVGPHIRLRIHPVDEPGVYKCVQDIVNEDTTISMIKGYLSANESHIFLPEQARYGGPYGLSAVLDFFTQDSEDYINLLVYNSFPPTERSCVVQHSVKTAMLYWKITQTGEQADPVELILDLAHRIAPSHQFSQYAQIEAKKLYRQQRNIVKSGFKDFIKEHCNFKNESVKTLALKLLTMENAEVLECTPSTIASSAIHLSGNKWFRFAQREHEAVAYQTAALLIQARHFYQQRDVSKSFLKRCR